MSVEPAPVSHWSLKEKHLATWTGRGDVHLANVEVKQLLPRSEAETWPVQATHRHLYANHQQLGCGESSMSLKE